MTKTQRKHLPGPRGAEKGAEGHHGEPITTTTSSPSNINPSGGPSGAVLKTLLLTDLVGSTRLTEELGDVRASEISERHDEMARELLAEHDGLEIDKTDGFLLLFQRPAQAVSYALAYHAALRELSDELGVDLSARAGIHLGEVILRENPAERVARGAKPLEVEGLAKPTAARVMALAQGGQTLLTQGAFELARRAAVGAETAQEARKPEWVAHGAYRLKGVDTPIDIFEVGVPGLAPLSPPPDRDKAKRVGARSRALLAAVALALVVTIVGAVALWIRGGDSQTLVEPDQGDSLAVLPFDNLSASEDNAYFAAGIHEDVLTHLAQFEDLSVISRTSVMRYAEGERNIPEIASELGVTHVLEGSVRRAGNQVRITMQLIDTASDGHLWAQTYDRELTDIFAVQSEVAREIASQLSLALTPDIALRIDAVPTEDINAYDLVLRARSLSFVGTVDSLSTAAELLEEARQRDPRLAEAHALLAETWLVQTFVGVEWADVRDRALQAIEQALAIDPSSATAHAIRARIADVWEADLDTAMLHYQRAMDLDPNSSYPLLRYADFLCNVKGQCGEALPYIERAQVLDPLSIEVHQVLVSVLLSADRIEDAHIAWQRGVRLDPDDFGMLSQGIGVLLTRDDGFGLAELSLRMIELDPENVQSLGLPVAFLTRMGEYDAAQRWMDRLRRLAPTHELYFEWQLAIDAAEGDTEGIGALLRQWRTMNSDRRIAKVWDGMVTPWDVLAQTHLCYLQAKEAHLSGRSEDERALRESAIEVVGDVLEDSEGNLRIVTNNIRLAVRHGINLRLVGREREATAVLEAAADYPDPYRETGTEIFLARLLVGDVDGAMDSVESGDLSTDTLDEVDDNELGIYGALTGNRRWADYSRRTRAERSAFLERLRQELPQFVDAAARP